MKNQIDEIKNRLDIVSFIGQYVKLTKAGRNFKGVCPFHSEKSPSFIVSPDRQIWHCFGSCATGGDVISFYMKFENLNFYEALIDLGKKTGVEIEQVGQDDKSYQYELKLLQLNILASKFYSYLLTSTKFGQKAKEYLENRKISQKLIETFELGYAPLSWDSLYKFLIKKGFSDQEIVDSGLVINSSGKYYDRFRNRLMFPLKNAKNQIVGFSGRLIEENIKEAKYVNTPETILYRKRENLYGINVTKEAIRKAENVYIFEGEFDLITAYKLGVSNVCTIKGAAFTKEQLNLLKRYTKKITFALDTDNAGVEAIKRGIKIAEELDVEVYVVVFENGKDPDEAGNADPVSFKKNLKNAMPIYDFLLSDLYKKYPDKSASHKKKIIEEISPYISNIQNQIVKSHYVRQLSLELDISEESIFKEIKINDIKSKIRWKGATEPKKEHISRQDFQAAFLIGSLLQLKQLSHSLSEIPEILKNDDFKNASEGEIFSLFFEYINKNKYEEFSYVAFSNSLKDGLKTVADELFLRASAKNIEPDLSDLIKIAKELRITSLQKKIDSLLQSDNPNSSVELEKVTGEYKKLRKNMN